MKLTKESLRFVKSWPSPVPGKVWGKNLLHLVELNCIPSKYEVLLAVSEGGDVRCPLFLISIWISTVQNTGTREELNFELRYEYPHRLCGFVQSGQTTITFFSRDWFSLPVLWTCVVFVRCLYLSSQILSSNPRVFSINELSGSARSVVQLLWHVKECSVHCSCCSCCS